MPLDILISSKKKATSSSYSLVRVIVVIILMRDRGEARPRGSLLCVASVITTEAQFHQKSIHLG